VFERLESRRLLSATLDEAGRAVEVLGGDVRVTLRLEVAATGLSPATPTEPGPNGTGPVLRPLRATGTVTVTGPSGAPSPGPRRFDPDAELARQTAPNLRPRTGAPSGPQAGVSPVVVRGMR
jgi:hypothetical protein